LHIGIFVVFRFVNSSSTDFTAFPQDDKAIYFIRQVVCREKSDLIITKEKFISIEKLYGKKKNIFYAFYQQ